MVTRVYSGEDQYSTSVTRTGFSLSAGEPLSAWAGLGASCDRVSELRLLSGGLDSAERCARVCSVEGANPVSVSDTEDGVVSRVASVNALSSARACLANSLRG